MKPKLQTHRTRLIIFSAISAVLGGALTIVWFPNTSGSEGTFLGKIFTATVLWGISSFLMSLFLQSLILLFQSRKQIIDFLRTPYSWSASLVVVLLSALPWLIKALIYQSEGGVAFLSIYGTVCFAPILVIGLIAAKNLSPRLNFSVAIKLLVVSALTWIVFILFLHGFAAIFFEPYIFSYPTQDELLSFFDFFWLTFLAVWFVWSKGIEISEKLPPRIEQFFITVKTYHPDVEFIVWSLMSILIYPFIVIVAETYHTDVLSTVGVWLDFTEFDKAAWRYSVGAIPLILGIAILIFLSFATIKLISQPTIAKRITANPSLSGFIAILWLFLLWWIFLSSIAANLNFLFPGEFG